MTHILRWSLLVGCGAMSCARSPADSGGTLSGRVTLPGESNHQGVTVMLDNGLTATSARDGSYSFGGLATARYDVTFSCPGCAQHTARDVLVLSGDNTVGTIRMTRGQVIMADEEVELRGAPTDNEIVVERADHALWMYNVQTGDGTKLFDGLGWDRIVAAADGNRIVARDFVSQTLWLWDRDLGQGQPIAEAVSQFSIDRLGTTAFASLSQIGNTGPAIAIDLATGAQRPLSASVFWPYNGPSPSPDGRWVAVVAEPVPGTSSVELVDLQNSGASSVLVSNSIGIPQIYWSKDSSRLAVGYFTSDNQLDLIDPLSPQAPLLTRAADYFSPNPEMPAFLAVQEGASITRIDTVSAAATTIVPSGNLIPCSGQTMTEDGALLLYQVGTDVWVWKAIPGTSSLVLSRPGPGFFSCVINASASHAAVADISSNTAFLIDITTATVVSQTGPTVLGNMLLLDDNLELTMGGSSDIDTQRVVFDMNSPIATERQLANGLQLLDATAPGDGVFFARLYNDPGYLGVWTNSAQTFITTDVTGFELVDSDTVVYTVAQDSLSSPGLYVYSVP